MIKFVWKNILTRFKTSKTLANDSGLQFAENPFWQWHEEHNIQQRFTSVAHPQANGRTEVPNGTLITKIKKRLGKKKGNLVDEVPIVLWSCITTTHVRTQETPFSLAYGIEVVLPQVLLIETPRVEFINNDKNDGDLRINIDLIEEKSETKSSHQVTYKVSVERFCNRRVRK